jgi:hypothetical protein
MDLGTMLKKAINHRYHDLKGLVADLHAMVVVIGAVVELSMYCRYTFLDLHTMVIGCRNTSSSSFCVVSL